MLLRYCSVQNGKCSRPNGLKYKEMMHSQDTLAGPTKYAQVSRLQVRYSAASKTNFGSMRSHSEHTQPCCWVLFGCHMLLEIELKILPICSSKPKLLRTCCTHTHQHIIKLLFTYKMKSQQQRMFSNAKKIAHLPSLKKAKWGCRSTLSLT